MKGKAKQDYLASFVDLTNVSWTSLFPNSKNDWFTEDLEADFDEFVPMGNKEAKASFSSESKTIFKSYSMGVSTNRDDWVYDWSAKGLARKVAGLIENYNSEVERYSNQNPKPDDIDSFVNSDPHFLKWTDRLKSALKQKQKLAFDESLIRLSLYRPFVKQPFYFDDLLIHRRYQQHRLFPRAETINRTICLTAIGNNQPFQCLMTDCVANLHLTGDSQCFPLYTFSADGSERFDNITGFALNAVRAQFGEAVSREDLFYAVYALLHSPDYRAKFAENLKRELPRLPLDDLKLTGAQWETLVEIGRKLGDLHVGYESATPFALPLRDTTPEGLKFSFRVEKMRWLEDKTKLKVNESIELSGFTPEMFDYKLGNRSALDWVVESYRVKDDKRSGLTSDPNRPDEPNFILDLVGKVATVSLETTRLVGELPGLFG